MILDNFESQRNKNKKHKELLFFSNQIIIKNDIYLPIIILPIST